MTYTTITLFNEYLQVNIETDSILLPPLLFLQHNDNNNGTLQQKFRRRITNIAIGIRDRKTEKIKIIQLNNKKVAMEVAV